MAVVYVVEDDAAIRGELVEMLGRNGFETVAPASFDNVVEGILDASPDLVLLDLTLPGPDGQLVCHELRESSDVPVIVLTSRTTEVDEVMSMTMGADDFVPKPYSARVLVARIQALLRRALGAEASGVLEVDGVVLDHARAVARSDAGTVELTKNEMRILALLMRRAGTIVSREAIMRELWDSEAFIDDNTLTVNVNRLRAALARIGVADLLVTHRGRGYSVRASS